MAFIRKHTNKTEKWKKNVERKKKETYKIGTLYPTQLASKSDVIKTC